MRETSYSKYFLPPTRYSKLQTFNTFKCGGSKCSCQFHNKRTDFDQAQINNASTGCQVGRTTEGYNRNSWKYLGL